jgi:hypothetical protein
VLRHTKKIEDGKGGGKEAQETKAVTKVPARKKKHFIPSRKQDHLVSP